MGVWYLWYSLVNCNLTRTKTSIDLHQKRERENIQRHECQCHKSRCHNMTVDIIKTSHKKTPCFRLYFFTSVREFLKKIEGTSCTKTLEWFSLLCNLELHTVQWFRQRDSTLEGHKYVLLHLTKILYFRLY